MYLLKYYKNSYLSYFLMYFFFFFSLAFFSGLLSVYLMDQGFSASQVSFVVSCSFILSVIVQPFIGKLNDVYESKYVNGVLLLIAGLLGIIFMFLKNIYLHLFIVLFYQLLMEQIQSLKEWLFYQDSNMVLFVCGLPLAMPLRQLYQDIFIKTLELIVFMFSLR